YAARSRTIPPLPWSSFPPPFSQTIAHGLAGTPTVFSAQLETSAQNDRFVRIVSADATNITISIWDIADVALMSTGTHAVMWSAEL
ncbi:hypothetical protein, partial [Neoaquamicrobium sediminum]|uniref:hypothetical protein n=1 Tax=Neoaquamicrobium sediminum TaxID=1849104 RepID=UPI00361ED636